jgi:hypothetical protein
VDLYPLIRRLKNPERWFESGCQWQSKIIFDDFDTRGFLIAEQFSPTTCQSYLYSSIPRLSSRVAFYKTTYDREKYLQHLAEVIRRPSPEPHVIKDESPRQQDSGHETNLTATLLPSAFNEEDTAGESEPTFARETVFWNNIYGILDSVFTEWESRVGYVGANTWPWDVMKPDITFYLPDIFYPSVIFGQKPDGNQVWRGNIRLAAHYDLVKLKSSNFKYGEGFGLRVGYIEGFDCVGGAMLFMALDRHIYYSDTDSWDGGDGRSSIYCYWAHGPYDLRTFRAGATLDPTSSNDFRDDSSKDIESSIIDYSSVESPAPTTVKVSDSHSANTNNCHGFRSSRYENLRIHLEKLMSYENEKVFH